jgi:hypothetical protein
MSNPSPYTGAATMSAQTELLLTQYRELSERIEALTKERDAIASALVALCPTQPGTVGKNYAGGAMWVDRVTFRDSSKPEWVMTGRKLKVDGTPHATASAYSWIRIEE